ncbi:MAG: thioether cross-link-forming SCIFF peptide maturase [Clostridia bacterium]|nr:thioether cross-link-forming SCIFF peptide maturase [Clostridia bacterium]
MTHAFEKEGRYYLFDTESGSLHKVDELCYDIEKGNDLSKYDPKDVQEAKEDIKALVDAGMYDTPCTPVEVREENVVKALCLHICHDCNLRCHYCFAEGGSYMTNRDYMSFEVGKNAIDFMILNSKNRRNLEIDYFGGEPLMNFEVVKQITEYAKEQGKIHGKSFKFTMTTNCILLDEEKIAWLNEEMDNIVLSIDGRQEVHDLLRKTPNGKGSWEIAIKNAKNLRKVRGDKDYYVRGTFTRNNLDFDKDVLELVENGFDQISVEPVVLKCTDKYSLREEDLPEIYSAYDRLSKVYTLYRKDGDKWFNFFHFMCDLDNGPCVYKRIKGCGAGVEYFAITPQGNIFPCHQFADKPEFCIGNVFDKKIDKSITSKFLNSSLQTKEDCVNCWAKYQCGGGCAANNYNFNGDIDTPYEISCKMFRHRLECAIHNYALEKEE